MASKFLTAEWRKLAIANYIINPALLAPYIPFKTEIDSYNGKCYISLIGFMFMNTKLKGFSIPFHKNFEEVNLRFYVRYKEDNEWKRGVTFIKEIVPKWALTFVANTLYREKYVTRPMLHRWNNNEEQLDISYSFKNRNKWNSFAVTAGATAFEMEPGSEEEFITEHYWGYAPLSAASASEYGVQHPRWKMYPVQDYKIDIAFDEVYGSPFSFLNTQKPCSVMLAEGSEIAVLSMRKIK